MRWALSGCQCPPDHGAHPWYVLHSALQTLLAVLHLVMWEAFSPTSSHLKFRYIMYEAAQGYLYTTLPSALILLGP
jgi:hypothetical protein